MGYQGGKSRSVSFRPSFMTKSILFKGTKVYNSQLLFNSKDVRLPTSMQRAMATEAEAAREARAKVIAAEGEQKASMALKDAADVISKSPVALQLRYLQTLTNISAEKNSTIVFPVPIEMLRTFGSGGAIMGK